MLDSGSPGRNSSDASDVAATNPYPVLNESRGYFILGPEAAANEMFYFNVIIGSPIGIHQVFQNSDFSFSHFCDN